MKKVIMKSLILISSIIFISSAASTNGNYVTIKSIDYIAAKVRVNLNGSAGVSTFYITNDTYKDLLALIISAYTNSWKVNVQWIASDGGTIGSDSQILFQQ
jgi:hypothetical protein